MKYFDNKPPKPFLVLAPMDDVTDTVFRQVVAGTAAPDLYFTEFVNVDGLQSIGREKLSDKGTASAVKRVDPVRSQTGLPRREVIDRMTEMFVSLNGGVSGTITPEEFAAAEQLAEEKFATEKWLHHIP